MAKNNPTEKQIDVEIQATLKHRPAWKLTEECKVYRYKIAKIDLNYKLKLICIRISEAVTWQCSVKKAFLKILQNLRENTYARVSFSLALSSVFYFIYVIYFIFLLIFCYVKSVKS